MLEVTKREYEIFPWSFENGNESHGSHKPLERKRHFDASDWISVNDIKEQLKVQSFL